MIIWHPNYSDETLADLRKSVMKAFSEAELKSLCFDLGIDIENLEGEGKENKVRELVRFCVRKNDISRLTNKCIKLRPNVSWPTELFISTDVLSGILRHLGRLSELEKLYLRKTLNDENVSDLWGQIDINSLDVDHLEFARLPKHQQGDRAFINIMWFVAKTLRLNINKKLGISVVNNLKIYSPYLLSALDNKVLVFDSRLLLGSHGNIAHIFFDRFLSVDNLLNELYFLVQEKVDPFTYETNWLIRDIYTRKYFRKINKPTKDSQFNFDGRTLEQAGITPNSFYEIFPAKDGKVTY